jgi:hypothetical protein
VTWYKKKQHSSRKKTSIIERYSRFNKISIRLRAWARQQQIFMSISEVFEDDIEFGLIVCRVKAGAVCLWVISECVGKSRRQHLPGCR